MVHKSRVYKGARNGAVKIQIRNIFLSAPMLTPQNFILPLCIAAVLGFGLWAIWMFLNRHTEEPVDTEFFLTARNTQPWNRVAWGLFVTSIGSGVIFGPASFVLSGGGWIGLVTYSVFAGLPLVIIASLGSVIRSRIPKPMSIASFAKWRYGTAMEILISLNVLFNLGIALAVEYTAVGSLFVQYLDTSPWVPILVVGIATMGYTIAGGLYISIITDQAQSYLIVLLVSIVFGHLMVNFRPAQFPPLPAALGVTETGLGSFVTIGVALTAASIFSDAIWQRVWSAESQKSLRKGAFYAMLMTIAITFFFAFGGFLAGWIGLIDLNDSAQVNSAFFAILKPSNADKSSQVPLYILTIVVLLAVILNEAAVDSFQNAILDTVISLFISFGFDVPLWMTRIVVVIINVPLMIVGTQGYSIISLYLMTNILTTCCLIPLCIGLVQSLDEIVTQGTVIFGCFFSLSSVFVLGYVKYGNFQIGLKQFFFDSYQWEPFVCALVCSTLGMVLYSIPAFLRRGWKKRSERIRIENLEDLKA